MANLVARRKTRGAAIVEAAIVLPLIALLTLGAIELGWAILKSQQVTNTTRQAARLAARPDATKPSRILRARSWYFVTSGLAPFLAMAATSQSPRAAVSVVYA